MPDAIGRLHWIVIDTVDPARIAPFWCALLGVRDVLLDGRPELGQGGRAHGRHVTRVA